MEMKTLVTLHLVSIFSFYLQALIQSKLIGIYLGFFASIKNIIKQLLDEVFVISGIIKVEVSVIG